MSLYDELDEMDMRIDYELEWGKNAQIELEKLNKELLYK